MLTLINLSFIEEVFLYISPGSPQYADSEIAADEIAAKNWPPMQRAVILIHRLAFRRHQFMPTHK